MSWDKDRIIELLLRAGDMAREARKKLTLEIKSDHSLVTQADTEIEARQILLSLTDGDKDHELRLRDSGDGTFSARADLPAMRDVRSLRLGTGEGSGRAFQMPELREGRNGFTGMREANGWRVTVVITTSGGTTITITVSG